MPRGPLSPEEAIRARGSARRFERFVLEHGEEIARASRELGLDLSAAAATMFSLDERRREREELCAPEEVLVGFGSTLIYGASPANISVQHQLEGERLLVRRLEVPAEVAANFLLTDLKVGKNSQFYSPGAVPMFAFAADAGRFLRMQIDRWPANLFLTLSVTNIRAQSRNFSGVLVCSRYWGWQGMGGPAEEEK